jgi:hypothetical protein
MMTDEESAGKGKKDDDSVAPDPQPGTPSEDEGRRDFIKKLPYVAPVIQTFCSAKERWPVAIKEEISATSVVSSGVCHPTPGRATHHHHHHHRMMTTIDSAPLSSDSDRARWNPCQDQMSTHLHLECQYESI